MITKRDVQQFYNLRNKPLLIGIAGSAGVGKTTLSENLKELYPELIEVIHLDDYIFPKKLVRKMNIDYSHPRVVDYKKFISHLYELARGSAVRHNKEYSFALNDVILKEKTLMPRPIVICEGWILFHYKALRELFNARIYLDLPTAQRVSRTISREILIRGGAMTKERMYYLKNISPPLQEKYAKPQARYATHRFYSTDGQRKFIELVLPSLKSSIS